MVTGMASIRGFIAASLDGHITTLDGGIAWLKPFEKSDFGYGRHFPSTDRRVRATQGHFKVV